VMGTGSLWRVCPSQGLFAWLAGPSAWIRSRPVWHGWRAWPGELRMLVRLLWDFDGGFAGSLGV